MKRDLYAALLNWKSSDRRKPLILRGARQVGKTYLLKLFGKNEYSTFIYLNFEKEEKLKDLFNSELTPATLLEKIHLYTGQEILPQNTLIIFDEVQESPSALNSLKYFQEESGEYHIIAAGSLLGVKLAHTKGFPVGKVTFLDLYPLSFFEFLDAIDKSQLKQFLMNINLIDDIPEPFHTELLLLLKKYLFIGGMPEAVAEYVKTGNFTSIRRVHKDILDTYELDFAKHAPKEEIMKITNVWEIVPTQLAKENKKFIFSVLGKSARGREYETALQWLSDAGLIYKSYNISAPKLPLLGYSDRNAFKVFLLDVGLLAAMSNIPAKLIIENNGLFTEFFGAFTENFVAQELSTRGYQLFYWASSGTAEVDFIIERDLNIYPLEVKAGNSRKKKSLLVYGEKYKPKLLLRSTQMNLKKDGNICNIPLYLVNRFFELCENQT